MVSTTLPSQAQETKVYCECRDIAQIQYQILETEAVVSAISDLMLHDSRPEALTEDEVSVVVDNAESLLNSRGLESPVYGKGGTTAFTSMADCEITLNKPYYHSTPCLQRAIEVHEGTHKESCERTGLVYRKFFEYGTAPDEMLAYTREERFLLGERKRLTCNCDYYALKYTESVNAHFDQGAFHQADAWHLTSGDAGFVMIPLSVRSGAVDGNGSGTMSMLDTLSTNASETSVSCNSKGQMKLSFGVSGRMARTIDLKIAKTMQTLQSAGNCNSPVLGTKQTSQNLQPNATASFQLEFTKIEDPVSPDQSGDDYSGAHIEARMVVAEKWADVKAANGRGSTVEQALSVIGFLDC